MFNHAKFKNNEQAQGIYALIKRLPYSIDEIDHDEFFKLYRPYVYKNDFLPNQLGKIFWNYYIKYRTNQVNNYENDIHDKNYDVLTEIEFIKLHGDKPWDVVNTILNRFSSMHYEVNSPEGSDIFGNYQLKLRHTEKTDLEIEFNSLSSGEKVLMALVASVYKSTGDRHFPELLLLDEVDASLHPSMMKNMLEVIEDIFLAQEIKVILVTHSPTTIALAPDNSVHVMNLSGRNRIEKKSRSDALAILTEGYATLEEGLTLFDEIARTRVTVVSEGRNTTLLSKALDFNGITNVEVLSGVEGISGKNQLKTLFDFLSRIQHENRVIFVWDCDVNPRVLEKNNTFPFVLAQNTSNELAKKGIENLFSEDLFDGFVKTITPSTGPPIREFDSIRKRDFEQFVLQRNNPADFINFNAFIEEVRRIQNL